MRAAIRRARQLWCITRPVALEDLSPVLCFAAGIRDLGSEPGPHVRTHGLLHERAIRDLPIHSGQRVVEIKKQAQCHRTSEIAFVAESHVFHDPQDSRLGILTKRFSKLREEFDCELVRFSTPAGS